MSGIVAVATLINARDTPEDIVSWKAGPNFRGTAGLLTSCITTLILCVWTAVHPNIPEHGKPHKKTLQKLLFLGAGLLAPEALAFAAFTQWRSAKMLSEEMLKHDRGTHRSAVSILPHV